MKLHKENFPFVEKHRGHHGKIRGIREGWETRLSQGWYDNQ